MHRLQQREPLPAVDQGHLLAEEASMAPKSKGELYTAIRRDCRAGLSKRAVMRKYGIGHPTVQMQRGLAALQ
jgi:hypothetical protein